MQVNSCLMRQVRECQRENMKNVLLLQIDGSTPNLALMRIAQHHRQLGHVVEFRHAPTTRKVEVELFDVPYERVYASAIFQRSQPVCRRLLDIQPHAIVGGTGWDIKRTLASVGIAENTVPDYSIYPLYRNSTAFTHPGAPRRCPFCVVPEKEGPNRSVASIADVWRGEPWPRNVLLLDNYFFGQPTGRNCFSE